MADRELIAATILAGLLVRLPKATTDDLMRSALDLADKLIAAAAKSPEPTSPVSVRWEGEEPFTPGTP